MMAKNACRFNPEPIALRRPMSLVVDDRLIPVNEPIQSHFQDCDEELVVDQHLDPEQQSYEFPPKSRLQALAYLDHSDQDTFFDESSFSDATMFAARYSFTSAYSDSEDYRRLLEPSLPSDDHLDRFIESIATPYSTRYTNAKSDHTVFCSPHRRSSRTHHTHDSAQSSDELEEMVYLVDDSRLSPLQLPARVSSDARRFERPSGTPVPRHVGPSAFFAHHPPERPLSRWRNRSSSDYPLDTDDHAMSTFPRAKCFPIVRNASEPLMDDDSDQQSQETHFVDRVVLIRLCKNKTSNTPLVRCATSLTCFASDEGYDDQQDEHEFPLESESCFLDLNLKDQEAMDYHDRLRTGAAVKIQAAWRGYKARKQLRANPALSPAQLVLAQLASMWAAAQRRQMHQMQDRVCELEQRLEEETAMRSAFEKAMEDMTLLMDQQQQMMHERIEQEVAMRQTYERRMDDALDQIEPLEARLREERTAHRELEGMMEHVLDQMQQMQLAQQQQALDEAAERANLQRKLDEALTTINALKKTTSATSIRNSTARSPPSPSRPLSRASPRASTRTTTTTSLASSSKPKSSPAPPTRPTAAPSRAPSRASSRPPAAPRTPISRTTTPRTTAPTTTPTRKTPARPR